MCGIVGLIRPHADTSLDVCDAFRQMWWATQLRGVDGSGLFQVTGGNFVDCEKSAFTPDYAMYEKPFAKLLRLTDNAPFTVAHCRAATKRPAKADEKWLKNNAHPFQHKHITLVHNGNFTYVGQDHNDKHEVDSASFTHAVADLGIDEALLRAYGAYALMFYDKDKETMNVVRNSDRPLYRIEHIQGHFYVSEPEMALWIIKRNGLANPTAVVEVPTHTLFEYKKYNLEFTSRPIKKRESSVYRQPHDFFDGLNYDDDEVVSMGYPIDRPQRSPATVVPINPKLTPAEVFQKAGRLKWEDCVWVATHRALPTGWAVQPAKDYLEILAAKEKDQRPTTLDSTSLFVSEVIENGMIKEIYHRANGFSLKRSTEYHFSLTEVHEHKGFCAIVGEPAQPITKNRVRIMGNMPEKSAVLKSTNKMLCGMVMGINKIKEAGRTVYVVQMGDLRISEFLDVAKVAADAAKKSKPQESALLLPSKIDKDKNVDLNDLVACPGCRLVTNKKDMKPYTQHLFTDSDGRATTSITITVCPTCHDKAKEDFDDYYQHTYLESIKQINRSYQ